MQIKDPQTIRTYYQALIQKDPEYIGVFFAGVKTTSIFCISTCSARKPKKENVAFFSSYKEALESGFRPCKVCKPTENAYETPPEIEQAIQLVIQHPKEKIRDEDLQDHGLSPVSIRRWFNNNYGLTYQAFQRMYRINTAYEELQNGKNITETAFDMGYESLSGFGYTYKKLMGKSPQKANSNNVIVMNRLTTPIGPMFICATETGVCLLEFTSRKMLETEFQDLQRRLQAKIVLGENEHINQAKKELKEYFEGKRRDFHVPLHTPGSEFQNAVWNMLLKIPYGQTTTYLEQARSLGKEKAVRAVASANGHNRVAIIIPCHRVIGSNGHLTGYAGGLERKKWLLDFEKRNKK